MKNGFSPEAIQALALILPWDQDWISVAALGLSSGRGGKGPVGACRAARGTRAHLLCQAPLLPSSWSRKSTQTRGRTCRLLPAAEPRSRVRMPELT